MADLQIKDKKAINIIKKGATNWKLKKRENC